MTNANPALKVDFGAKLHMIPACDPLQPPASGPFGLPHQPDNDETGFSQPLNKSSRDPLVGTRVGQYDIEAWLGGGSMGVVYKARDRKLGRPVALKFLPRHWSDDDTAKERFVREAQAASAADHRNICTIHNIESTDDGALFIVMAYYSGKTLKQMLTAGALGVDKALDIAQQVAEGLAKAHAQGVVHRDIKPGNLILTDDDCVKILDFGLAKFADSQQLTTPGSPVGTAAYMSPEQTRGKDADVRSDIWAVGVVLFEMLAGQVPFKGGVAEATFALIENEPTPPLRRSRPDIPEAVEQLVRHTLEKDPALRFHSARELAREIRRIQGQAVSAVDGNVREVTSASGSHLSGRPAMRPPSIAVLPFRNISEEKGQDYFCDGLTEEFINAFTKIKGLRVAARTSVFQLKDQTASRIREALNVDTVLDGSVRKTGDRVRITVELLNTLDESRLWRDSFDRKLEDIFAVQDEIAGTVVRKLRGRLATDSSTQPAAPHAGNLGAYLAYLQGRYHWNKRTEAELRKSVRCFEQAIAADPSYAQAHVGLADALVTLGTYGALPSRDIVGKASSAVREALLIDNELAEAYVCRGCLQSVYNWSWLAAEGDFTRAIDLNPGSPAAHHWYAINYLVPLGRFDEATEQLHRALELDPLSLVVKTSLGMRSYFAGSYEQALHELSDAIELDESFVLARVFRGHTYTAMARFEQAHRDFEAAIGLSGRSPDVLAGIGYLFGVSGDAEGARRHLDELQRLAGQRYVSPTALAQIYAGLGDKHEALNQLEEAVAARAADLAWLKVRPFFVNLHAESRFGALLKRLGLDS